MRTSLIALWCIAAVIAAGFYLLVGQLLRDSRTETYQTTEETLIDTARVLAALVEGTLHDGRPDTGALAAAFDAAGRRKFSAMIQQVEKTRVGLGVYVTDEHGIVLYDSAGQAEGQDFSRWNDVLLTLKGGYGVRSTRRDPDDPSTSVMHVAAPVHEGERIAGVLTVVKAKSDQAAFLIARRNRVLTSVLLIGGGLLLFMGTVFFWLFRPMRQLADYAQGITAGRRPALPRLGIGRESRVLAGAMESMREELEGREYASQYVRTLTHELKSPLAAIEGAAELLEEPMPDEQRQRFLTNIRQEAARAERLIRRLLRLSEVERLKALESRQAIRIADLLTRATDEARPLAAARGVTLDVDLPDAALTIHGTPELLQSALLNLLENAIDFSPARGVVGVTCATPGPEICITDEGPGIPEYAQPRLFERFYSLKQSQTGRRGTGLGLCFVREVAALHGATVRLANRGDAPGAVATVSWAGR